MGKVSQNSANYVINAKLKSSGIVKKSDVVGAVFGQTEGLLGEDLDLRELRNRGKVGRIEVELEKSSGSTEGKIEIATSLDAADTSILAASLETIDKIGPTNADIRVQGVSDVRSSKRDYIVKRSKQILSDIRSDNPEMEDIKQEVKQEVRESETVEYEGFVAGPDIYFSDEVILVEGEADVKNLAAHGVKNSLALGGTSIPAKIPEITEEKQITAFLDGDRGGDLILEELRDKVDVEYVVRAPEGLEVEELNEKQIFEALRDKEKSRYVEETDEESEDNLDNTLEQEFKSLLDDMVATRALNVVDSEFEIVGRAPVDNKNIGDVDQSYAVIADAEIDEDLLEFAEELNSDYVVGRSRNGTVNSSNLSIVTEEDIS